ncbi:hypothetical protein F3J22_24040 [Chitinophaga sp. Cy-1792]|nr:hypothetical protein [Chitinophaga sp. Cy-1792]
MKPNFGNIILFILGKNILFALAYNFFVSEFLSNLPAASSDSFFLTVIYVVPYLLLNLLLFSYPLYYSFKVDFLFALWIRFMILSLEAVILMAFAFPSTTLLNAGVSVVAFVLAFCIKWKRGKPGIAIHEEDNIEEQSW